MGQRALLLAALLSGCVDGFQGSNIQFDFSSNTPVQASQNGQAKPGQLPAASSLALYALDEATAQTSLFEVQRFEIHRVVDLASPCFIDVGEHVPYPGIHVSQFAARLSADDKIPDINNPPAGATAAQISEVATAQVRQVNVAKLASDQGIKVISSASDAVYPAVDADCSGSGIPAPSCSDDASNARRLLKCQAVWAATPELFEGTDRVLVSPLSGTTYGMVDGFNPINQGLVGGAQFFVPTNLDRFTTYAIYERADGATGLGDQLYYGHAVPDEVRGVRHVRLVGNADSTQTAELVIFANLDDDSVQF